MHRRRPGHRGGRRTRLIGAVFRWLDRVVSRAARRQAAAGPTSSTRRASAEQSTPNGRDALERAFDRSGYVREAAVRELGSAPRADAIRVLLVRANDWVPEVRAAAAIALRTQLRDELVGAWALALDALEALRRGGRGDAAAVLAAIDAFLVAPERLDRIVAATRDAPVALRRSVGALRRAGAHDDAALAPLLRDDASGADIVTALAATRAAEALQEAPLRDAVWRAATASPHAAVRRAAIAAVLASGCGDRAVLIERFAFDPSAAVRASALDAATASERVAITAAARQRLDAPWASWDAGEDRRRAIALQVATALGAFASGPPSPWLQAPGERTRAVAFAGSWQRSNPAGREALLLAAFADAAPRVQRWAARAVLRDGVVPDWRALLAIVLRSPSPQRLRAVRRALGRASPWWRLAFELALGEATGSVDRAQLGSWCVEVDRSFAAPASGERDALAAAWLRAEPRLPPAIAGDVRTRLVRFGVIAD